MEGLSVDLDLVARSFVAMFVMLDPVGSVPIFLALTKGSTAAERRRSAAQASAVAAGVIVAFALFGQQLLDLLGIGLPALQVAGGLLLLLLALELTQPFGDGDGGDVPTDGNAALVPLGTPLLAGPGAIATVMVFAQEADGTAELTSVGLGLATVLVSVYVVLRFAEVVARVVRDNGIRLLSRVLGLIVGAIAVQLIAAGIERWVRDGVV